MTLYEILRTLHIVAAGLLIVVAIVSGIFVGVTLQKQAHKPKQSVMRKYKDRY